MEPRLSRSTFSVMASLIACLMVMTKPMFCVQVSELLLLYYNIIISLCYYTISEYIRKPIRTILTVITYFLQTSAAFLSTEVALSLNCVSAPHSLLTVELALLDLFELTKSASVSYTIANAYWPT